MTLVDTFDQSRGRHKRKYLLTWTKTPLPRLIRLKNHVSKMLNEMTFQSEIAKKKSISVKVSIEMLVNPMKLCVK